MILINLETKKEYFLPLKKTQGEEASVCPECSEKRKKKTIKCFSFNHDKKAGRCGHCQISLVEKREFVPKKDYKKPVWNNTTNLSPGLVKWFEDRGISQKTLIDFKITEAKEWMPQVQKEVNTVHFNYFRDGQLVNIKYRDGYKNFKLYSGAELILYNLDSIKDSEEVILVEGEADCMALHQAGYPHVVSVPNGAGTGKINMEYLDNCIEYFLNKKKIYLATDNDLPGRNLQEQLAERFGKERCYKVQFKSCKDANECLVQFGVQGIKESIEDASEYPLEGVFTISDYEQEVIDIYEKGLPKGARTMMTNFNNALEFHKGYITTITGIPNQGKSDALDQITLQLALNANWKGAFYTPENKPTSLHISKLARKLIGKKWWGENRISKSEIKMCTEFLNDRFFFIKPENDFTLDSILREVKGLVLKKGIDFFVIDAWNKLEHKYNGDENRYIGECLDKLGVFCERNNVHLFLVAHPRKMMKDKDGEYFVPNLYDISGSANFFNKSDNGICIYRDFVSQTSKWYIQKVKFNHWGSVGMVEFKYDLDSGRFNEYNGGAYPSFDTTPWIYNENKPTESQEYIDPF
jgi:twinkle protein